MIFNFDITKFHFDSTWDSKESILEIFNFGRAGLGKFRYQGFMKKYIKLTFWSPSRLASLISLSYICNKIVNLFFSLIHGYLAHTNMLIDMSNIVWASKPKYKS